MGDTVLQMDAFYDRLDQEADEEGVISGFSRVGGICRIAML